MIVTYSVSITDIIQAIGVGLGFPAAVWGIFQLFRKDKDKTKQLKALKDIAISQDAAIGKMTEQILELSKQTNQFEYHSMLFKESNDLLKEQIRLQTDAIINDKDYKEKYLELEKKKRKTELKPFFKPNGAVSDLNGFFFKFKNFGERAFFEGIEEIDSSQIIISKQSKQACIIEKNETWEFIIKPNNRDTSPYEVNLLFYDLEKNKYKQNLKGHGLYSKIGNPEDRE